MKRTFAIWLLAAAPAVAADYYGSCLNTYDPITGLYYKGVSDKEHGGFMSGKTGSGPINLAITNPSTGVTQLLFKEPLQGSVSEVLFETGAKDGSIDFCVGDSSTHILNNRGVARKDAKSKLLVVVRSKEDNQNEIYFAEKDGSNLKKAAVVPQGDDWHIDVKNSKVRVVHQTGNGITIESIDW